MLYTKDEAAKVLKIGIRTLEKLIRDREMEYYRVGSSVRISEEQLKGYLDRHCTPMALTNVRSMSNPGSKTGSKQGQRQKKNTAPEPDLRHYVPGMKVV